MNVHSDNLTGKVTGNIEENKKYRKVQRERAGIFVIEMGCSEGDIRREHIVSSKTSTHMPHVRWIGEKLLAIYECGL